MDLITPIPNRCVNGRAAPAHRAGLTGEAAGPLPSIRAPARELGQNAVQAFGPINPVKPVYLLIPLVACNHSVFAAARFIALLQAVHLGATPVLVGIVASLFALLPALTSVGIGRLIDRKGPRGMMLICSAMLTLGSVMAFLWRDLTGLCVVGTIIGTAFNAYRIGDQQLIGYYSNVDNRTANYSLYALGTSASLLLAPVAAGFVIDAFGHSWAFLLFAVLPIVPLFALALNKLPMPKPKKRARMQGSERKKEGFFELLRSRELRRIYLVGILLSSAWDLFSFLMPVYGTQAGLSASNIGLIIGAFSLATFVIRIFLPFAVRRLSPWKMLIITLVLAATSFLGFPAFTGIAPLMVLAFLLGTGLGMTQPMSVSLLYEASPPDRAAEAIGFRITLVMGGSSLLPLLSGALGSALGVIPVFWATSAILFAGAIGVRRQWRHR